MSYVLQALVGKGETLQSHTSDFQHVHVVPLPQGLALIPIVDDLHEHFGEDGAREGFYRLSSDIEVWAQQMSASSPVAYIEAEFFGGDGSQSAVVWSGCSRAFGPVHARDAIDQALHFLGVRVGDAHDEFAALHLGRHRDTNSWRYETRPPHV
jgi:hypothetical protein